MEKNRLKSAIRFASALLGGILLVACSRETDMPIVEKYRTVELTVSMHVASFLNSAVTRTPESPLPGDLGDEENRIHNITIFQFDGTGDDSDPLVVLRYADSNLDKLNLGLMQPISNPGKQQFLYFVANTENLQNFSGTYGELRQQLISVNENGKSDGLMPMTASLVTAINPQQQSLSVKFSRKLAKINATCSIASVFSFTPVRLQLRNVPKTTSLMNRSETVPEATSEKFQNYLSVSENITGGYTWYIPENKRGKGTATGEKDKTDTTAPNGQGEYCTYVEISGLQNDGIAPKLVSYRIYLGNDNVSDYNVESNRIYNVDFSLAGMNTADKRIQVVELPAPRDAANCYMVLPGTTVLINLLVAPGAAVSGIADYATCVGTAASSKIKSIGVVWQTADTPDGLIQDLTFFESTGQALFKASPGASGNLLLAAYSEAGQKGDILWSWHIWISDYDPGKGATTGEVPGGNVYYISQDGGTWMDRDLGATTATPGAITTIGYAYQWGRKDPFPLSNGISSNILRPLYNGEGDYLRSGTVIEGSDNQANLIQKAIAHPDVFYTDNSSSDMEKGKWWTESTTYPLWTNDTKTMFDPCPAGWKIPSSAFIGNMKGYTMQNWNTTTRGAYYRGVSWYQYCGYLSYMNAGIGEPGSTSVYWSSAPLKMYQLSQNGGQLSSSNRHLGFGFIGRCVKIQSTN
ncbi:DUF4906 domain-containing protein [Parabacteroides acidifaciens]|uniref:DUF4906 domain-containing protein n=1 Tax=Parabacteroides acidifaciens TaxID=2290935 RepID=A0A3D8HCN5_9BACT|nr:DUF4906 domain-containing protein [Parabacteroides acidifaciens]MBC8602499.1 DUF4906 domain-containing protein [Parabacteroides acidifaciens]RDU48745.1 DUF4906 domain-containing protein [Parabacteroides acidifaciens]